MVQPSRRKHNISELLSPLVTGCYYRVDVRRVPLCRFNPAPKPAPRPLAARLRLCPARVRPLQGWWTYEFCHRKSIRQFHQEKDVVVGMDGPSPSPSAYLCAPVEPLLPPASPLRRAPDFTPAGTGKSADLQYRCGPLSRCR